MDARRAPARRSPSSPTRPTSRSTPPARASPGRVWAFRRPVWLGDLPGEAVRAGLVTAAAFPIALGDECVGVIELYATDVREPNAEVSALFATVGGQLAAYFARRRVRARARRSFDGAAALVVALDTDGRVEIANGTACAAFGFEEDDLVGRDWFAVAVPEPRRAARRLRRRRRRALPSTARRALALVALARRRRHAARRGRLGRADADGHARRRRRGWGERLAAHDGAALTVRDSAAMRRLALGLLVAAVACAGLRVGSRPRRPGGPTGSSRASS